MMTLLLVLDALFTPARVEAWQIDFGAWLLRRIGSRRNET